MRQEVAGLRRLRSSDDVQLPRQAVPSALPLQKTGLSTAWQWVDGELGTVESIVIVAQDSVHVKHYFVHLLY